MSTDLAERGKSWPFRCPAFLNLSKRLSSPYINRFLQPDTIIPNPANPQLFNRYSYVMNNPVRYNDPTGHKCGPEDDCDGMNPELVNLKKLTDAGKEGYKTYRKFFKRINGVWVVDSRVDFRFTHDGDFTVKDFVTMILFEEGGQATKKGWFSLWEQTAVRGYYEWTKGDNGGDEFGTIGLLNYMYAQSGTNTRTEVTSFDGDVSPGYGIPKMRDMMDAMLDPTGAGHPEWAEGCEGNVPCQMGSYNKHGPNLNYIDGFRKKGCPSFALYHSCGDDSFTFFLTADQANYWHSHPDPEK